MSHNIDLSVLECQELENLVGILNEEVKALREKRAEIADAINLKLESINLIESILDRTDR